MEKFWDQSTYTIHATYQPFMYIEKQNSLTCTSLRNDFPMTSWGC